jgi:hypothetical protein
VIALCANGIYLNVEWDRLLGFRIGIFDKFIARFNKNGSEFRFVILYPFPADNCSLILARSRNLNVLSEKLHNRVSVIQKPLKIVFSKSSICAYCFATEPIQTRTSNQSFTLR